MNDDNFKLWWQDLCQHVTFDPFFTRIYLLIVVSFTWGKGNPKAEIRLLKPKTKHW